MADLPVLWDLTPDRAHASLRASGWIVRRAHPEDEGILEECRDGSTCEVFFDSTKRGVLPMSDLAINLSGKGQRTALCWLTDGLRLKRVGTPAWRPDPDRPGGWCLVDKTSGRIACRWQGQPGQSAAEALRSLCDAAEAGHYPPHRNQGGRPPGPPRRTITVRLSLPAVAALVQRGPTLTRAATDLLEAALSPKETQ